ncbi:glycerate kinase [Maribacter sp. MJ134]|uniref:glycerate kinase n=1 Tax=Maribacter sp. MJ134 TaxID=2496865 RepID=UPI000F81FD37|nr:glycerate kinase [Maribacter sp. MJ134]AZQ57425.1 glycerate kinase [Maribacter sp. MJ134]
MKFVIAPDKYKGSLTGLEFCEAVSQGLRKVFPTALIKHKPLADGGDGTLAIVRYYLKADTIKVSVNDPLFRKIEVGYLLSQDKKTAFIEMSEASGYKLLHKNELNCMSTTSLGTGELIVNALNKGVQEIILGIGGSATTDGGMGIAVALGYEFLDRNDTVLSPIGGNLLKVSRIQKKGRHPRLSEVTIKVACDVTNPFFGKNGAAYVYGPQKGANKEEVEVLDKGLQNFAKIIAQEFGTDIQKVSGSGAAGGVGGGAVVFLNATLIPGIDLMKEIAGFDEAITNADWIVTGEGRLDSQTLSGKTIAGVLESARKQKIPVAALCGAVTLPPEQQEETGLTYVCAILRDISNLEQAVSQSKENLVAAAYNFAKLIDSK